jgi:hypothetical protein
MQPFQASEEFTALVNYFQSATPGSELAWSAIESATGVAMDGAGKAKARRALAKTHPGHAPVPGWGIRIASAATAKPETGRRLKKATRAMRRSGQYAERSLEAHGEQMDVYARQSLQLVAIGAKTIQQFARAEIRKALNAPKPAPEPLPPMLPRGLEEA